MKRQAANDAKDEKPGHEPFTLGRSYSVLTLAGILVTAIVLAVLYRELSIRTIIEFGEQSNASIASAAVNAVFPELAAFLTQDPANAATDGVQPLPKGLQRLIDGTPRTTSVDRIKIYNAQGIVLWSSLSHEIGSDHSDNSRFQEAMQGAVFSKLSYHDAFDLLSPHSREDNLIETYVPIYQTGRRQPIGVFEVYSDVDPMVRAMNRNELVIISGIALIMALLYGLLRYAMHRSERVINAQRQAIILRSHQLETLSARSLATEEAERRQIAISLHEEIAQDLSAAKFKLEAAVGSVAVSAGPAALQPRDEVIVLLQNAIREVRGLATELRPSSLDDFGLVATARALCQQTEQHAGEMRVQLEIHVPEEQIPDGLKTVIFRILQQSLRLLGEIQGVGHVRVILRRSVGIELVVEFGCIDGMAEVGSEPGGAVEIPQITAPWSRAILSGGTVQMMRLRDGRCRCLAAWPH